MTSTRDRGDVAVDVVVVGGGAAGLSAALALGRSRRRVLVVDAGEPRNAPAAHAHNYLGRESVEPLALLAIGRAEVAAYAVEVVADRVVATTPVEGDHLGFAVTLASGRVVEGRRVLVASGVVDELPDVPGLAERWGRDVLHCPYCHGWEVRDRAVAVLATTPLAAHHALLFRQLTDDVTVVLTDGVALAPADTERLTARGVRFVDGSPREVVVDGDRLVGVRLADGGLLACDAVVVASRPRARVDFLAPLQVGTDDVETAGVVVGTVVAVDVTGATSVPGVHAAGNVTDVGATLIASAAHGMRVGAAVNAALAAEDADRAVARRREELFEAPAWEERYRGDRVWSGRPNVQLVAEVAGLQPGRALDVGCGEGGDAVWLAEQGWEVTAADFADGALARTAAAAREHAVAHRVTTRRLDVRTFDAAGERWDLVTSQFVHLPDGGMVDVTRRLAAAVAPGGTLLVVCHHPGGPDTGVRHEHAGFMVAPDELRPALDEDLWEVEVCDVRPRSQPHPATGAPMTVQDSVLRARRRGDRTSPQVRGASPGPG